MRIKPIPFKSYNPLIHDYRNHQENIMNHFDYSPFHDYEQRLTDLKQRTFKRKELAETLYHMNKCWGAPQATFDNIKRLKKENSVVVIGGQQAGLMTGPMYTINKIISILQFSRQQEKNLNVPVIPVFWIAGEDHDYDEINHVFLMDRQVIAKHQLLQPAKGKPSISNIQIDRSYANEWLNQLFEQLNETSYTKDIYVTVKECLDQSNTYVDFFAKLLFKLFTEEGLVLIDSGAPEIRKLESDYFVKMIHKQPDISKGVYHSFQQLTQSGYSISVDITLNDTHLFIHHNEERILLVKNKAGEWVGKQNEVKYSTDQLLEIALTHPEILSNNVVTRPVMQELIFPTLSFIGGLGEISYWAILRPAFKALDLKMPPVLPRLSFTYIDQQLQRKMEKLAIDPVHVVNYGVEEKRGNWLAAKHNPPIHYMAKQLKQAIDDAHRPLRQTAGDIRSDLGELAKKNLDHLNRDVDFLVNRINQALAEQFEHELADFDLISHSLFPQGGLQERIWNPLYFINMCGPSFLKEMIHSSCSFEEEHYIVYI